MPQITQAGALNTTALLVPDLYVQIVPPQVSQLNGVPSNGLGIVGTAQWGPVNSPATIGSMAAYASTFGAIQARKYDLGTAVAAAVLQGAQNMRCVRVTDGTDTAATIVVQTTCLTLTSKYTGTLGNTCQATIANGSAANTFKITIAMPGQQPEVFDNIAGSANALWVNMAAAINSGQYGIRGPSNLVVATAGAGTTAPSLATVTLAGGTDGAGVTADDLLGTDTTPREGMYALRGTGVAIGVLADVDDSTKWTDQVTYGLSEGTYMILAGAAGESITTAVSNKATAGIDSYAAKVLLGDWCYFNDLVNGVTRLVSPQGFIAGLLSNLAPQNSSLNKQLYGIVGTQKSYANQVYSSAELQQLAAAGIDAITNPIPAGNQFGARIGHNSSSNPSINGDNYTRMTNYIATTLAAGMGLFLGKLQSIQPNDPLRAQVKATVDNFLQNMKDQGQIDDFNTQCDLNNNPPSRIALGYLQDDISVRYLSVVEKLLLNMQGGQTVTVTRQQTQPIG